MRNSELETMYVELHSRSAFSFLEGASLPEALAGWCAELQMPAMALLDRDGVYGAPRFHLAAKKLGVKAHIGAEVTIQESKLKSKSSKADGRRSRSGDSFRLPLLIANRTGYQNLCRLITRIKMRAPKYPLDAHAGMTAAATLDEIAGFAGGLICLTGGDEGPLDAAVMQGGMQAGLDRPQHLNRI